MIIPDRMKPLIEEGIFCQLYELKSQLISEGKNVIDLSVGSPDIEPAAHVKNAIVKAASMDENYRYAICDLPQLRKSAARWYKRRFDVEVNPVDEITSLLGSQEGLAHIFLALADKDDIVLVPNPGYPVYHAGPQIAQCKIEFIPTDKNNLIDFDAIDIDIAKKAKIMLISYPNNPTTAIADITFFNRVVEFAKKYDIMVIHDNAYCELTFDGYVTNSFLNAKGAKDVGIELNSLSKTYNVAGIRTGFAFGNKDMIKLIATLKSHMDYGMFLPIQYGAIAALDGAQDSIENTRSIYQKRRDILLDGLNEIGWQIDKPKATMFVWAKLPAGYEDSFQFAMELAQKTGVIVTPGSAFGDKGEGYVRIALVQNDKYLLEAVKSIEESDILQN